MKIIAFGHRQDVGKSTAGRFLSSILRTTRKGINIQQAGFADKVKDVAYQLYSWAGIMPGWFYDDPENYPLKNVILPAIGMTPRDLWIGVGNGVRKAYDRTWLDYLFKNVKADILIISDLRFPTEAEGILQAGGYVFRVDRATAVVVNDGADNPLADFKEWTAVIQNNGTLNDFHKEIENLINRSLT